MYVTSEVIKRIEREGKLKVASQKVAVELSPEAKALLARTERWLMCRDNTLYLRHKRARPSAK